MELKEIGEALEREVPRFQTEAELRAVQPNGGRVPPAEFRFGTFVVRCVPTQEAVAAVARKFAATGQHRRFMRTWWNDLPPKLPTLRRPPNADKLLASLEDCPT